jgi:hypothetical protein
MEHPEWHSTHNCCPHMNMALVKIVSVVSRLAYTAFDVSGLEQ